MSLYSNFVPTAFLQFLRKKPWERRWANLEATPDTPLLKYFGCERFFSPLVSEKTSGIQGKTKENTAKNWKFKYTINSVVKFEVLSIGFFTLYK